MDTNQVKQAQLDKESAESELLKNQTTYHDINPHTFFVEIDGQWVEKTIVADDILMLDEFDDDELTEEGQRSAGVISKDYDSTSNETPVKSERKRMSQGTCSKIQHTKVHEDGTVSVVDDYLITCPYTGSTEVYQVSSYIYASYETDEPFIVKFEFNDEEEA